MPGRASARACLVLERNHRLRTTKKKSKGHHPQHPPSRPASRWREVPRSKQEHLGHGVHAVPCCRAVQHQSQAMEVSKPQEPAEPLASERLRARRRPGHGRPVGAREPASEPGEASGAGTPHPGAVYVWSAAEHIDGATGRADHLATQGKSRVPARGQAREGRGWGLRRWKGQSPKRRRLATTPEPEKSAKRPPGWAPDPQQGA